LRKSSPSMETDLARRPTYTPDQFAALFSQEDDHFWFCSRNRSITAVVKSLPHFDDIRDVLEVGCGTGVVLAQLRRLFPQGRVVGMDLFEESLRFARQRFQGVLIQGDVEKQSFAEPLDLIGAFDVIEHLDDDEGVLRHLSQQIRPGGHLVLTVPAHRALWSYFDEDALHRRRYSPAGLKLKMEEAGFTEVFVTQFMSVLLPVMWLRRCWFGEGAVKLSPDSQRTRQAIVKSDLHIHPVVNALFKLALWPEAFFIAHRIPLPFGSSLLAIGRRPVSVGNTRAEI